MPLTESPWLNSIKVIEFNQLSEWYFAIMMRRSQYIEGIILYIKLQVAKTACGQKLLVDLFSPKPQPARKKNSHFRATVLLRTLCRRWKNCHHLLEDANKTYGQPRSTPPRHSQQRNLHELHYFSWNEHTPTSQRIYRFFYCHSWIFFNWSWGWPWNRCSVFRRARKFELFLCGEKNSNAAPFKQ